MSKFASPIESLLLIAGKPLAFSALAKLLSCSVDDIQAAVSELEQVYNKDNRGIHVLINDNKVQLATNPDNRAVLHEFVKDETTGELTRPSLETLTIIAYRQPVTKEELEQIRGVNCSLILRNLMIRGLVEAREERGGLATVYAVTMDFLRFLGINRVEELPDYDRLHNHESLQQMMDRAKAEQVVVETAPATEGEHLVV